MPIEYDYHTTKPKKYFTPAQALLKAASFCAYQERTQQEVRDKLYTYGLHADEVEEVLTKLITEKFINEERYAQAYASGKLRNNYWGRIKIKLGMKQKGLSAYCIKKGLAAIDPEEYLTILTKEAKDRLKKEKGRTAQLKIMYTTRYLLSRGFESDLINEILKDIKV